MSWHFDPQDTPEHRRILRSSTSAQKARERFPAGTKVRGRVGGHTGTVQRHVPGINSQGGLLVIRWDTGHVGRVGPITVDPHHGLSATSSGVSVARVIEQAYPDVIGARTRTSTWSIG